MNLVVTAASLMIAMTVASAQVRDAPAPASAPRTSGTASIAGIVLDDQQRPVRRALVRLEGERLFQSFLTDSDGTFTFADLPAGRYRVIASKPAYVNGQYGSKRPGSQGTSIAIGTGGHVGDLVVTLARGAVITGRVVNALGEPAAGIGVRLLQSRFAAAGRTFQPIGNPAGSVTTDDRGAFRFFGLDPGQYVVSASPRLNVPNVRLATPADVDRAERELASGSRAPAGQTPQLRPVAYAPVYYPGTISLTGALPIMVGVAEERGGIDFRVDLVATTTVAGTVTAPDGQPAAGAGVSLVQTMATPAGGPPMVFSTNSMSLGPDGVFRFDAVIPGEYVVMAATGSGVMQTSTGAFQLRGQSFNAERMMTSVGPLLVTDAGLSGLTLRLRPGILLTGRLVLDGRVSGSAPPVGGLTVGLTPIPEATLINRATGNVRLDASGQFSFAGVTPGRYLITVSDLPNRAGVEWTIRSVVINGIEVVDTGLEVTGNEGALNAVVTLTDRSASLAGVFQDASGQPASDYTIVLFGTDRTLWRWGARRITATRPSTDGKYVFPGLPPGEYFLTAVTDAEQNEWFDPQFLAQLVPASIKVTIADGEKKVQDIRVK